MTILTLTLMAFLITLTWIVIMMEYLMWLKVLE